MGRATPPRNEDSLTIPETAYGGSKLVAEKIHAAWQHANPNRRLIILRPGVVFGPGEHANVARLARSLERGYFVYMGNRGTRKAGVYVKELCHVLQFAIEYQEQNRRADSAVECFHGSAADAGGFCERHLFFNPVSSAAVVGAAQSSGGRVLSCSGNRAVVWNPYVGESSSDEKTFAVHVH